MEKTTIDKPAECVEDNTYVIFGSLNYLFDGFNIPDCTKAKFYGLEIKLKDNYHVVMVKGHRVHCLNLLDDKGKSFTLDARLAFPFKFDKNGENASVARKNVTMNVRKRRGKRAKINITGVMHPYMNKIRRVFNIYGIP